MPLTEQAKMTVCHFHEYVMYNNHVTSILLTATLPCWLDETSCYAVCELLFGQALWQGADSAPQKPVALSLTA